MDPRGALSMPLPCHPSPLAAPLDRGTRQERAAKGSSKVPEPFYHQGRPKVGHCHQPVPPSSHPYLPETACPGGRSHLGAYSKLRAFTPRCLCPCFSFCLLCSPFPLPAPEKSTTAFPRSLRAQLSEAFHNKPRAEQLLLLHFPL